MLTRPLTIFLLTLIATDALANICDDETAPKLDLSASGESLSYGHADLGHGAVLSEFRNWDGHTATNSSGFRIEFCQSGSAIDVIYKGACYGADNPFCSAIGLDDEGSYLADEQPIRAAVWQMATSSEVYRLDDISLALTNLSAHVVLQPDNEFESCGCAVFYPDLIGDKRPNSVRTSTLAAK